jgi:hypothetical protein
VKCGVCGQDYGVTHNCAGIAAMAEVSDVPAAPQGFALFHYLQEAFRIAIWNDAAIRRTMNDPNAILYGVLIYTFAVAMQLVIPVVRFLLAGRFEHAIIIAASLAILLIGAMILDLIRVAVCHALSKWFAAGSGEFTQLLGPLLLGSVVYVLVPIPFIGPLAGGIAWICVFAMVFQKVHGIEPLTAFLFSGAVGVVFFVVQIYSMPLHHF